MMTYGMILPKQPKQKKNIYIESYGCAMNFSDSELIASIMKNSGYQIVSNLDDSNIVFLNTCAIREKAEQRIRQRIRTLKEKKRQDKKFVIGVLGCMAERLKTKLLDQEKLVDIIAGPDAYKDLPNLVESFSVSGEKGINVLLSKDETYGDIAPLRYDTNGISAWVTIMRGCDNMCSFCVVPFTRGRERSRDPKSIVEEVKVLSLQGYKEVTLLGQNVDSYFWYGGGAKKDYEKNALTNTEPTVSFSQLLDTVATVVPEMRIRFSTSNPRDMTDDVFYIMKKHENICKYIHLPFQSGSNAILKKMNRGHTREWYLERVKKIKEVLPMCGLSADIISGFCSETEEEHQETLSLMSSVEFDYAYTFSYSERGGTPAEKKFKDDVPSEVKSRRLSEIIFAQRKISEKKNKEDIGKTFKVLVEGVSKKSEKFWHGRADNNKVVIFENETDLKGKYIDVKIIGCTSAVLSGKKL